MIHLARRPDLPPRRSPSRLTPSFESGILFGKRLLSVAIARHLELVSPDTFFRRQEDPHFSAFPDRPFGSN